MRDSGTARHSGNVRNVDALDAASSSHEAFDLSAAPAEASVVAAAFAATHPRRVRFLSVTSFPAMGAETWGTAELEGLLQLIETSWPLAVATIGGLLWPNASPAARREHIRMFRRDCIT